MSFSQLTSFDLVAVTKEGHILRSRNKDAPQVCIVKRVKNALNFFAGDRILIVHVVRPGDQLVLKDHVVYASIKAFDRYWNNVTLEAYARKIQRCWRRHLDRSHAAKPIQRTWRSVIANPKYAVCRRRLLREFESLDKLQ